MKFSFYFYINYLLKCFWSAQSQPFGLFKWLFTLHDFNSLA